MKEKANSDIREAIKAAHCYLWQVAERFGLAEATFCRRLRHELPQEEKTKIFAIISELKEAQ